MAKLSINQQHEHIAYHTIMFHISNYRASKEELEQAAKLADARVFDKVKTKHLKEIGLNLYKKATKLLYIQHLTMYLPLINHIPKSYQNMNSRLI